eukprot:snap_masked-scaffold_10-processed-gene-0.65-mRNA-1 protein AED:1.00 eAED:1.00 QI:0/0/0/0/1/1/3/0/81
MLQVSLRILPVPCPFLSLCMFPASFFVFPLMMFTSPALGMLAFFMCSSGYVGLGWRRVRFVSLESLFKALDVPELAAILDF